VVAVCQTVSFAHSRGVLHRDLKPSNILLGAFGEVLVLDWGLAMEMRKEEGGRTKDEAKPNTSSDSSFTVHPSSFEQTEAGQVLGTPAYMAPEQAAGQVEQIDARTDVFGLGAILYEVLTGAPPFAGKQDGTRQPPVRPRRMDPQVAPALDAICVKALAHDPGARYMAAAALAEDLQRWLADEPVSAYPEPWTTRAGRWMRRHRAVVISALVLLVMGVAGLASTTVLVNQQRRRAEASLATALDAVDSFLVKISEEKLLYQPGLEPLRTELLRTARDFGDKFVKDSQDEPARRRELARMLLLLGKASAMSSDTKQALGDLNRARKLYRELQDRQPDDAGVNAGLARCQLEIGKASRQLGSPETKAELQAAVDLLEREPESADARRHLALAHYDLGLFFINANELADARKHLDQAIAADERAVQLEPDNWIHRSNLAAKLNGLGEWLKDQDKHEEAKTLLQSALEIRQRILDKGKINPLLEDGLAVAHNNLGHMALREKNLLAAESHFAAELKHCRHLAHQSPGVPRYRLLLGRAHSTTSNIHSLKKAPARALEEIARGVAILESLQEDYPEPPHAYELAVSHLNLAYRLREDGKDEMARNALDQAEKTVTPLVGDPTLGSKARLRLRDIHWTRAHIWGMQMRIPECLLAYERALQFDDGSEGKRLRLEHDAAAKLLKK
jgi:serine/threonine-protein kinase